MGLKAASCMKTIDVGAVLDVGRCTGYQKLLIIAVTLTIVCIALGGFVASTMARMLVGAFGWRALFIVGGLVPIVLCGTSLWSVQDVRHAAQQSAPSDAGWHRGNVTASRGSATERAKRD